MFGYIRPYVPSLRVAEYEYYRAAYCTICRAMGKNCGSASRFCLTFDSVFLALLRGAVTGSRPDAERGRCPVHPLAHRQMLTGQAETDYAAAVCGVLAAGKFADDAADEKCLRRAAAKTAHGAAKPWLRRADERYPGLSDEITALLQAYSEAEANMTAGSSPVDSCAAAMGEMMAALSARTFDGEEKTVAAAVGRHVGRWLCTVDALDDLREDLRKGRANPFAFQYPDGIIPEDDRTTLTCLLNAETAAAADALDLLPRRGRREAFSILYNILREGMPHVASAVLDGTYRKPRREKLTELADRAEPTPEEKGDKADG